MKTIEDPYPSIGFAAGYLCEREAQDFWISFSQVDAQYVLTYFDDGDPWKEFVLPVGRVR